MVFAGKEMKTIKHKRPIKKITKRGKNANHRLMTYLNLFVLDLFLFLKLKNNKKINNPIITQPNRIKNSIKGAWPLKQNNRGPIKGSKRIRQGEIKT